MDAKQTNRIFWVGATGAALWLTYRALKQPATKETIAVSNTPSTITESVAEPTDNASWIMDLGEGSIGAVTWQQARDLTDANLWVESLSQSQKDWCNMAQYISTSGAWEGPLYDTYVQRVACALNAGEPLASFTRRVIEQIQRRLGG